MRFLFEDYALDTDLRELRRRTIVLSVTPQVFDLLDYLIRNRARVVSKDDLINAIWHGRNVSDAALTTRLNSARSAIGDSGQAQRLVKTLPRKGFRFVGPVIEAGPADIISDERLNPQVVALTLPDRPSIAVLPFQNMSDDPEQQYFVDGMVEDIITGLSRSKLLFVISRNSSFTYKGKAADTRRVGRELGVRYVLEGSVRKAGKRIRVTGQLIDASTDGHIWAEKFDGDLEDMFDLQDRLTSSVIGAIWPHLERAEMERVRRKPNRESPSLRFLPALHRRAHLFLHVRRAGNRRRSCRKSGRPRPESTLGAAVGRLGTDFSRKCRSSDGAVFSGHPSQSH